VRVLFNKRMLLVKIIVVLLFTSVLLKVFYIQIFSYEDLNEKANNLWIRNLPIEAERGRILDRNGVVLADNLTTTGLVLVPNQIVDKEYAARKLAEILNVSYEEMYSHVSKKTSIERVHPEGRRMDEAVSEEINALNLEGVYTLKESKRYYPFDTQLSHVLGFVGIDNQGLSGLELYYDHYLTGSNGSVKYYSDARGQKLDLSEIYEQPTNGIDVYLTIDHQIQTIMERELTNVMLKYNPDSIFALAMNPNTGEILGMASSPTFSSENYQDYEPEIFNRNLPIWMSLEPGSTFKIITLAAALEEGVIELEHELFHDSGSITVESARIKCWKHGGHGTQTFLEVVENSCNPGFVTMGKRVGAEKLYDYIDDFGFLEKTGIDLNGESKGIMFSRSRFGPIEHATTSFGQGISVTPIQLVTGVSAAVNGGDLYQPYIAKMFVESKTNEIIKINKDVFKRQVISEETSNLVRYALESVVAKGTGKNAYIEGYRVGGKTGTAQKVKDGRYMDGNYILSFVGIAPMNNPQIVVYVGVDNPKGVVQYGGVVAAPIVGRIIEDSLMVLGIERQEDQIQKEINYFHSPYYDVEDVEGLTVSEAIKKLSKFRIEYSGEGKYVIKQSPEAGIRLELGSTIRLYRGNLDE